MEKATLLNLTIQERKLLNLLKEGNKYSVTDISQRLRLSDPRSVIRYLRNKGIPVQDVWRKTEDGKRYKVYFLNVHVKS